MVGSLVELEVAVVVEAMDLVMVVDSYKLDNLVNKSLELVDSTDHPPFDLALQLELHLVQSLVKSVAVEGYLVSSRPEVAVAEVDFEVLGPVLYLKSAYPKTMAMSNHIPLLE